MPDKTVAMRSDEVRPVKRAIHIVSSAHLATSRLPELSEFEYGLILAAHALDRWMVRCMAAAGAQDMSALEVTVLCLLARKGGQARQADIAIALGIEDTHQVAYVLKKLFSLKLLQRARSGKEVMYAISPAGGALCQQYAQVRETCLMQGLGSEEIDGESLSAVVQILETLSGCYNRAVWTANFG